MVERPIHRDTNTPTAIKVERNKVWIHHCQVKQDTSTQEQLVIVTGPETSVERWRVVRYPQDLLEIRLTKETP